VTLSNHNTYTGGTIVNAGALAMGIDDALPVGSNVTLANTGINARLELNQFTQHLGTLTMDVVSATDTALRSSTGGGTVFANTFDFRNGRVVSAVTLAGTGSLVKTTFGNVRISGTGNTYTGNTIVSDGFLQTDGGEQSLGAANNQLIISNNATLTVGGDMLSPNRNVTIGTGGATFNTTGGSGLGNGDATFGTMSGTGNVTKNGTSALTVASLRIGTNSLNVGQGKLVIAPSNGAFSGTSRVGSLNNNSLVDITDNKLITTSSVGTANAGTYDGVSGQIQSGRNGGGWTGAIGIVTSKSDATTSNFTSIGVATGQQVKALANPSDTALWGGQTVSGSDALVMYTYGGDANLDGKINVDDYGHIDSSVVLSGVAGWFNGDFNYDGKINVDDYGIIDSNVPIQGAAFPTAGSAAAGSSGLSGVSAVPEPASFAFVVAACGVATLKRRRRNRH
jgi:autotransporter-associated beta strand protein